MAQADDHDRRRWGRWFLIVLMCLLILLVGGHILWSTLAGRTLDRQAAIYHKAGEPIELEDLAPAAVPDADNIAIALRSAARIDETTPAWKSFESLSPQTPLTDNEVAAIRAVVGENGPAFADVDAAMNRQGIDWQISLKSPALMTLLPDLGPQRKLARLMIARAMLRHRDGDDAGALQDVARARFIAQAVDRQPILISHLVAMGIDNMSNDAIQRMAPALRIGNSAHEVPSEEVSKWIALLLDDEPARQGLRRALLGERALELDTARCLADGRLNFNQVMGMSAGGLGVRPAWPGTVAGIIARPIACGDGLIMIRQTTAIMKAADAAPNWPAFEKAAPPDIPPQVAASPKWHMVASLLMPSMKRAVETAYRAQTEAHLAAAALAARQYQLHHGGALPAKMDDLSAYLPRRASDPMSPGALLRTSVGADGPVIYSVGENGADDGGSEAKKHAALDPWVGLDVVVHLTPTTRPAQDDEQGK
jgi:hypothetical protein